LDLAKQHDVDLGRIFPTGADRRITLFDVQNFIEPKTFRFYHEAKRHAQKVSLDHNNSGQLSKEGSKEIGREAEGKREGTKTQEQPPAPSAPKNMESHRQTDPKPKTQSVLDGDAIKGWSVNPKALIPHFWLRKSIDLRPTQLFLKEIPEDRRVGPGALYIKLVRDAILEDPEFFTFRINGQYLRANTIWIHYINLADPNLNRSVNIHSLNRLTQDSRAEIDHSQPSISIVDASGTEITTITPIIRLNRVI
jgi:hypothetical protein